LLPRLTSVNMSSCIAAFKANDRWYAFSASKIFAGFGCGVEEGAVLIGLTA
jgi:hypothetical protein